MKLHVLLKEIEGLIIAKENFFDYDIQNLAIDYKKVTTNSLFFCISKEEFLEAGIIPPLQSYSWAITQGAIVIVSNAEQNLNISKNIVWIKVCNEYLAMALITKTFYKEPFKNSKIIGITGTNGKTTTNQFIDSVLNSLNKQSASVGTLGIMSDKKNVFIGLTTPFILDLYQHLNLVSDLSYLVMEITSHASHFQRTASLEFDLLIFTNLTSDHLDFHLSWQAYKKSKLDYFSNLYYQKKKAIALINKDDSIGQELMNIVNKNTKNKVFTYSLHSPNADFFAKILKINDIGSQYIIYNKSEQLGIVKFPMAGLFNIYNSLAAFCACYLLGFPVVKIIRYLEKTSPVAGRFEKIANDKNQNIFIDYAHTADSLENILSTIQNSIIKKSSKKLIIVFGCGGDRDKKKRPIMGKIAAQWSDFIILTNDNPRTESPDKILADIQVGIPAHKKKITEVTFDRRAAIYNALKKAGNKDVVLIAGKGHENYQIIGNTKSYFLDKEVVLDFFQKKKNNE